jgi:hypothetical protein
MRIDQSSNQQVEYQTGGWNQAEMKKKKLIVKPMSGNIISSLAAGIKPK